MLLGARAVWLNEPKASAEGFPVSSQQRVFSLESVQDFLLDMKSRMHLKGFFFHGVTFDWCRFCTFFNLAQLAS